MTAMASLSDLAATGGSPLGMLLSAEWGPRTSSRFKKRVAQGFETALSACDTYWLGGDTGRSACTVLTGTAIGLGSRQPLSRIGARPGDWICISGPCGTGAAFGLRWLRNEPENAFPESWFRPVARLHESTLLAGATAVMDTSDGLLSTLDTLAILNDVGFDLTWDEATIDSRALHYCRTRSLPLWLLWAAELGDLQLVASIPEKVFFRVQRRFPGLLPIGRVTRRKQTVLRVPALSRRLTISTSYARNQFRKSRKLARTFRDLAEWAREAGLP
jgi:thiamine-monophosphate kinase